MLEQRQSITKPGATIYGVGALLILLALFLALLEGFGTGSFYAAKRAKLEIEFNQIQAAVMNYYTEYAKYPVTSDNASLVNKLRSANPRGIQFLALKPGDQDANGAMLDPWGTPIEMSVSSSGVLHARSAGSDKTFDTDDDILKE